MANKTRKQIQLDQIKAAYFRYWRLQNDPEYQTFFKDWEPCIRYWEPFYHPKCWENLDLGKEYPTSPLIALKQTPEEWWERIKGQPYAIAWMHDIKQTFGIASDGIVHLAKQIDWTTLDDPEKADPDIMKAIYGSESRWNAIRPIPEYRPEKRNSKNHLIED